MLLQQFSTETLQLSLLFKNHISDSCFLQPFKQMCTFDLFQPIRWTIGMRLNSRKWLTRNMEKATRRCRRLPLWVTVTLPLLLRLHVTTQGSRFKRFHYTSFLLYHCIYNSSATAGWFCRKFEVVVFANTVEVKMCIYSSVLSNQRPLGSWDSLSSPVQQAKLLCLIS